MSFSFLFSLQHKKFSLSIPTHTILFVVAFLDVTSPSITCPEDLTVENDPGKPAARVTLPRPTASDNTGEAPTITISPPDVGATHEFHIGNSTVITYVATDAAGWKTSCSFSVKVKGEESVVIQLSYIMKCWSYAGWFTSNPDRSPNWVWKVVITVWPAFVFRWSSCSVRLSSELSLHFSSLCCTLLSFIRYVTWVHLTYFTLHRCVTSLHSLNVTVLFNYFILLGFFVTPFLSAQFVNMYSKKDWVAKLGRGRKEGW